MGNIVERVGKKSCCDRVARASIHGRPSLPFFPPLWYDTGLRQVGMGMRVHGYVALNSIAARYRAHSTLSDVSFMDNPLLPFSLGLVACDHVPLYVSFFFSFSSSCFPFRSQKPCQWEREGIKLERKNAKGLVDPCRCIFPRRGSCRGESLFNCTWRERLGKEGWVDG